MADQDALRLNAELALLIANYWHEVDVNLGRNANRYYTEEAEFQGPLAAYRGKRKIQQFYAWRVAQGARLSVHSCTNLRTRFAGPDAAEASYYLHLYAANGVKPLPTHAPITISMITEHYVRQHDTWLCSRRHFETWFEGDTPITNPDLDEAPER